MPQSVNEQTVDADPLIPIHVYVYLNGIIRISLKLPINYARLLAEEGRFSFLKQIKALQRNVFYLGP